MKTPTPFRLHHLVLGLILTAVLTTATACKNTAHGAGKDIEKVGEKIQEKTQ